MRRYTISGPPERKLNIACPTCDHLITATCGDIYLCICGNWLYWVKAGLGGEEGWMTSRWAKDQQYAPGFGHLRR